MLKYTANGNAVIYSRSVHVRRASAAIRRYIKLENPITLGRAAELGGIRLSSAAMNDIVADQEWISSRVDHSNFRELFLQDANESDELRNLISEYVVSIENHHATWPPFINRELESIPNVRLISATNRMTKANHPSTYVEENSSIIIDGPLLKMSEAKDFLRPIWMEDGKSFVSEIAGNLIESAALYRIGENFDGHLYSENDLDRASISINRVIDGSNNDISDESIAPRPSLVDATVFGDRVTLQGQDVSTSGTPLDQLEVLREHYLRDATRLRDGLAGSNSGQGFVHRLDSLCISLERPLSDASSLLVATQVRALEDMMPAMQEIVADITAADVGASITGLGLYARQFPAWQRFLANAQLDQDQDFANARGLIEKDIDNLKFILESQPDELVDPALKLALEEVHEAASESNDSTLSFGYMRAVGNVYRAVARYMKERRDKSIEKFNEEIDSIIAKQTTNLLISGIAFAATTPLLNLAAAMPHEFGWFLAVYAMVNFARK